MRVKLDRNRHNSDHTPNRLICDSIIPAAKSEKLPNRRSRSARSQLPLQLILDRRKILRDRSSRKLLYNLITNRQRSRKIAIAHVRGERLSQTHSTRSASAANCTSSGANSTGVTTSTNVESTRRHSKRSPSRTATFHCRSKFLVAGPAADGDDADASSTRVAPPAFEPVACAAGAPSIVVIKRG